MPKRELERPANAIL